MSSCILLSTSNVFTSQLFIAKRTTYDEEMARTRPLHMARQRGGGDAIELTDSGDSARRPRPSQPSTSAGPRPSVLGNKDDQIIIISSSEDDLVRPTHRRKSGTQGKGANQKRVPPPADADVISISDSEEDLGTRGGASKRPTVSAAPASTSRVTPPVLPSQGASTVPPPPPKPAAAPAPIPEPTPLSTSTPLPEHPPSRSQETQQQDNELPSQPSPSPSYGPPPDDFDDAFGDIEFDTTGDDAHLSGALDGWDNIDAGPSLATLPVAVSSGPAVAVSASVPEGGEDVSGSDELFDSYLNMDELSGVMDKETSEDALPGGGNEAEESAVENGVTIPNRLGASTRESLATSRSNDTPTKNIDGDGDLEILDLEEGEVDSNETPVPFTRSPETPESGEIRSQESGGEVPKESQPPSSIAPLGVSSQPVVARLSSTPTLVHPTSSASISISPSSASPRSTMSAKSASQPLGCAGTLAIPDISSYKGVRFKRPLPEARENSFFSRALNGAARPVKTPASVEERNEQGEGEGSASGGVPMPVEVPSSVGEEQEQDGDADMQDDTALSMPESSMASPEAVVPTPPPVPQQPAEAPMVSDTQSISSTAQVQSLTVEPSTIANDGPPASTQPTTSSIQTTPSQPPAATQPLARSSSRPFIAPPRIPRPSEPMSLVSVLNEVRRERLQARKEERELARKRSVVELLGASSHLHRFLVFIASHVRMQTSPPHLPRALAKVQTRHPHPRPHNPRRRRRLLRNRRERLVERRV